MQKNIVALVFCLSMLICKISYSADYANVNVVGEGATKELAIKDGLAKAVKRAFGSLVYSQTTVKNSVLESDQIQQIATGFVTDYKIVFENVSNKTFYVSLAVTLDRKKLYTEVHRQKDTIIWPDKLKQAALIKSTQSQLQEYARMLERYLKNFTEKAYSIALVGFEIEDIGLDYVVGNYLLEVSIDKLFWETYAEIISNLQTKSEFSVEEGMLGSGTGRGVGYDDPCRGSAMLQNVPPIYSLHKSLAKSLAKPIDLSIKIGDSSLQFSMFKNAIIFGQYAFFDVKLEPSRMTECIVRMNQYRTPYNSVINDSFFREVRNTAYSLIRAEHGSQVKLRRDIFHSGDNVLAFKVTYSEDVAFTGDRFIIKVPFKLRDENDIKNLASKIKIQVNVNGGGHTFNKSDFDRVVIK